MKIELSFNRRIDVLLSIISFVCFIINHKFRFVHIIHIVNYDQGLLYKYKLLLTLEILLETFFKFKSSISSHELDN